MAGQQHIEYEGNRISYFCFGNGPQPVLCFHGYGESAGAFSFLGDAAGQQFCFIAVDLPAHGQTEWKEYPVDPAAFSQGLHLILERERKAGGKCMLLGFSLGGRVALHLLGSGALDTGRLVLLAPDGMKENFWYRLATQSAVGRMLFRATMHHPGWFFWLLKAANRFGMVNSSIFKFVNRYIGDDDVRHALYQRWTGLRLFKPKLGKVQREVERGGIPCRILYGRHDRIILPNRGHLFIKEIPGLASLTVIDAGHQLLHPKYESAILAALQH